MASDLEVRLSTAHVTARRSAVTNQGICLPSKGERVRVVGLEDKL
jgi:hypothetical protein